LNNQAKAETTMNLEPTRRSAIAVMLSLLSVAPLAHAQSAAARWPAQAVRFVVPFPAGSAPDVLIRHVGAKLGEKWGQGVIVDNKPGGSGVSA
jgi:tripartite-type tricarboxylate transporter receptor subunit TctC